MRRRFGCPFPRQPAHLHTQAKFGAYARDSSRFPPRRPLIYLNRHTPSGKSRVYRTTQLRTDGVQCRKLAGAGPVVLKVVPGTGATGAALAGITMRQLLCASLFPHPVYCARLFFCSSRNGCCLFRYHHGTIIARLSFPTSSLPCCLLLVELLALKKNLNASRPPEHPLVRGENVKMFRWDHRLQRQNIFMAF